MNNTTTSTQKMIVEVYRKADLKQVIDALNVPVGMMLLEGVLGRVDSENRNKRFYERAEYQKHIDLMSQRILENNGILGELEHPKSMNIDLNNASHKVMSIRLDEDGFVRGTVLLLDTPKGMIAQSVVRSGSPLPISSRAVGKVQENGSVKLDFMSTFDIVGIAGFQEAALYQPQRVSESFDEESGQLITEMYEYDINDNGDVIAASTMLNIVESVTAALTEKFVHVDAIEAIVEARLNEFKASKNISESVEEQASIDESHLVTLMNERFANVYSPIIENWITNQFAPKMGTTIQEWLSNDYSNVVESWIKEDVLPANANLTESWITSQFAPKMGTAIQEWLSNDHANLVESWLTSYISEQITESAKPADVVDKTVSLINEEASIFASRLLTSVDVLINEASQIEAPTVQAIRIDETNYMGAPTWLKLIPTEHKVLWQSMNENQRGQIFRKASVRILEDTNAIERFWRQIDFNAITSVSETLKRDVNETLDQPIQNPLHAAIKQHAASLRS